MLAQALLCALRDHFSIRANQPCFRKHVIVPPALDVELISVTKRYGTTAAAKNISPRIPRDGANG